MLTSWATVQVRLNLDASQEAETTRLIEVASVRAERYTKRILAAETLTFLRDGNNRRVLDLKEWPINSVVSVEVNGSPVEDYHLKADMGHIVRRSGWPHGDANIAIEANVGYTDIPADLEESVIQLVGYWLDSPNIAYMNPQEGVMQGGHQMNYVGVMDLPYQIRNVWDSYTRVDF